jgi:hypothetical protein
MARPRLYIDAVGAVLRNDSGGAPLRFVLTLTGPGPHISQWLVKMQGADGCRLQPIDGELLDLRTHGLHRRAARARARERAYVLARQLVLAFPKTITGDACTTEEKSGPRGSAPP